MIIGEGRQRLRKGRQEREESSRIDREFSERERERREN